MILGITPHVKKNVDALCSIKDTCFKKYKGRVICLRQLHYQISNIEALLSFSNAIMMMIHKIHRSCSLNYLIYVRHYITCSNKKAIRRI